MSEVYEGIVFKAKKGEIEEFLDPKQISSFDLREVGNGTFLILFNEDGRRGFYAEASLFAREISVKFHKSALFQYDSRVSYRAAAVYVEGELSKNFGEEDELYVILDEAGYPDENAEPVSYAEILDAEEYETSKNAIELGLEQIDANLNWGELKAVLYSA